MTAQFQTANGLRTLDGLKQVFPSADAMIVSALAYQSHALMRYLAQTHELTQSEVAEAAEAFFDWNSADYA